MSGTVVVGYIPSPEGVAAFEKAKDEALLHGARIVVVNTGQSGDFATPSYATPQDIDAIRKELEQTGLDHDVVQATDALAPAEEILRVAEAEGATLIVIGMRQRSPVGKLFLGSTSQQVLLDASCAVLAVKAPRAS